MKRFPLLVLIATGLQACSPSAEQGVTTPGLAETEFIQACAGVADYDVNKERMMASGWTSVLTDSDSALEAVIDNALLEDAQVIGDFESLEGNWAKQTVFYNTNTNTSRYAYKKIIDDRDFHIVLMKNNMGSGGMQYGCSLYDFQEGYNLGMADEVGMIRNWLQAAPTGSKEIENLTSVRVWSANQIEGGLPHQLASVAASNVVDSRKIRKNAGYYGRSWILLTGAVKPNESE